jgi:hypothetical protein
MPTPLLVVLISIPVIAGCLFTWLLLKGAPQPPPE